jgi:uncharacterized membrane protein
MTDTSSYLRQLEGLLEGLPAVERQYAIAFYTEYLMDAGPQGQAAAMAALGTPEQLASQIRADVAMRGLTGQAIPGADDTGSSKPTAQNTWTQSGSENRPTAGTFGSEPANTTYTAPTDQNARKRNSAFRVTMIVLAAIFALPIGIPLAATIFGLVIAMFATVGALFLAAVATGFALFVTGVMAIVVGMILLFSHWATGLFYLGIGLMLLAFAVLVNLALFYLFKLTFRGFAYLFDWIRRRLNRQPQTA